MRTKLTYLTIAVFFLISHVSCDQASSNESFIQDTLPSSSPKQRRGFITGKATTISGSPVAGATIAISGFSREGVQVNRYVETKEDGTYEVQPPKGGIYRVSYGEAVITLDGDTYGHRLHPLAKNIEELKPLDKGLVSNFVLRLTGLKPQEKNAFIDPMQPGSYYGPYILLELRGDNPQNSTPDSEIEVTLTPKSLLADGTKGKTITFRRTVKNLYTATGQGFPLSQTEVLPDIPLAIYAASATIKKPGAQAHPLLLSTRATETLSENTEVKFKPSSTTGIEGFILTLTFPS